MSRFCLLSTWLLMSVSAIAQTWIPSLSAPATFYNNVQISDITKPDPPLTVAQYGTSMVTSAVATGGTVTYTATKGLAYAAVGHVICVSIGLAGPGCTSAATILTPGNNIDPSLLGSCTLTAKTTTPTITFQCASTSTSSWTLTQPYFEQNASTVSYNNQLWQVYSQASAPIGGPGGPPSIPGLLYVRTSSSTPSTFPPVWNTPFNLNVTSIPNCTSSVSTPPQIDVRIPLIGLMPNGDMDVWIDAECYPFSSTVWFMHHDHTQAYTAGWTGPTQITQIPTGWASVSWGCFQDAGEMNYDPTDGMPIFTLGGGLTGTTCVNGTPFLFKTTDNGVSWFLVKQIFTGLLVPTFEFSMVNPTGTTWIAFIRMQGNGVSGQFWPPYFSISTDNMTTWGPWTNSHLPVSNICDTLHFSPAAQDYAVSPVSRCGNPASGLCVLFYADRIACGPAGVAAEMAVQYDPALLLANGSAYTSTLKPTTLHNGIISSNLDGYQYVIFPTASTFHMWWHGINSNASVIPLNIWESHGQFSNITSTITVTGGGAYSGTITTSDGGISCTITSGTASGLCSEVIIDGTAITMTASVGRGSSFGGFSGWCGGSGSPSTCTVNTNQSVTATFNILIPNAWMSGTQRQGGTVVAQ